MKKTTKVGLIAIGLLSLVAVGAPNSADAKSNHHRRDTRNDRAELQRDLNELRRDRSDLRDLYRNGGSRSDIARKRAEIRQDLSEVRDGRRALGYGGHDNYGRYDDYRRSDNGGWWNRGSRRNNSRWNGWGWR